MHCENCGEKLNNKSKFCKKCGAEVNKNNLKKAYLLSSENQSRCLYMLVEKNGKFITDKYFPNKNEALKEFKNNFKSYKIVSPDEKLREYLLNKYKNRYKKFQKKDILGAIFGVSIGWSFRLFGLYSGGLGTAVNIIIGIIITRLMLNSDKLYLKVLYWFLFAIVFFLGVVGNSSF